MNRIFSTGLPPAVFNLGTFILRVAFGGFMLLGHGLVKVQNFEKMHPDFLALGGMSSHTSLLLAIFAEAFCSALIVLGLFTRLAAIPLIFTMGVAVFVATQPPLMQNGEKALLFMSGFIAVLFLGPGKWSLDGLISRRK